MAQSAASLMVPAPTGDGYSFPLGIHSVANACGEMTGTCFKLQLLCLQILADSPATWKAWQDELWDEWRVCFFGGAPIDG